MNISGVYKGLGGVGHISSISGNRSRLLLVVAAALLWALLAGVEAAQSLPPAPGLPGLLSVLLAILPGLVVAGLALAFMPSNEAAPMPLEDPVARFAAARSDAEALEASLVSLEPRLAAIAAQVSQLAQTTHDEITGLASGAEALARHGNLLATAGEQARTVTEALGGALSPLATSVETIRTSVTVIGEDAGVQLRAVEAMLARVHSQNSEAASHADAAIAALASHFTRLDDASKESTAAIAKRVYALDAAVDGVLARADSSVAGIAEQLIAALSRLDTGLDGAGRQLTLLGDEGVRLFGQRLDALVEVSKQLDTRLQSHDTALDSLQGRLTGSVEASQALAAPLAAATQSVASLDAGQQRLLGNAADLAAQFAARFAECEAALARFTDAAQTLDAHGLRLGQSTDVATANLSAAAAALDAGDARLGALAATLVGQFSAARTVLTDLEAAAQSATSSGQRAAEQATARLLGLVEAIGQTEARIDAVETRFALRERNTLARDASGLMASLSANIGDLAQLLDLEVAEADWRNWLRGDRSVLPALIRPLLDNENQRRISRHIVHDPAFRSEATRFLDQFEQLLARLLGDRDGDSLAAVMLSADIGKLYIRLADAAGRIH
jgi:chromosome segregation ATPase